MKWYYSKILRKIIKLSDWEVAIRRKNDDAEYLACLSENEFIPVQNTEKYWYADPILFNHEEKTWLFVEAFNKEKKRGEIGVFEVNEDCSTGNYRTVVKLDCHMSYPYVFDYYGDIYMIPESGANKKVYLYKAINFPYDWKQVGVLCENKAFRDSTVYCVDNSVYMLTYERTDNNKLFHTYACYEYKIDIENCRAVLMDTYEDQKASLRPAGFVAYEKGNIIRSSQKCNRIYGESLIFWKISISDTSWKAAQKIKQVNGSELKIRGKKAVLTHTYSCTDVYETIDYRTLR